MGTVLRFRAVVLPVLTCAFLWATTQTHADDSFNVLQNLKNYDSIYEAGFTVSCTRHSTDTIILGRQYISVTRRWRLTFEGDRVGYLMELVDYEKPHYVPPEQRGRSGPVSKGPAGPWSMAVRAKQWGYWGHDLSGHKFEDKVLTITPTGEVSEIGKMHNSSLYGPRDPGPVAPRRVALWSLGRFFSKYLDDVTSAEKAKDGRLIVTATGRRGEDEPGRWELEIEPTAAWMVRKARFYKNDRVPIEVEMKNEGTIWSGTRCIPKRAEINPWGALGEGSLRTTEQLDFDPVVEDFDKQLYSSAEQAVAHDQTPTLTIHDFRVFPPTVTEPFRPKPVSASAITAPHLLRNWLVAANLGILVAIITFFLIRKRRKAHEQGAAK